LPNFLSVVEIDDETTLSHHLIVF